jgi:hypothetical protein
LFIKVKIESSIICGTNSSVERQKMPPDAASRTITHYSVQDSKYVIDKTRYDSESSDQGEPEKKPRLLDDIGQKSISSSLGEVRYPSIPLRSTSLEENDSGNGDKPLPTAAEDQSSQRSNRSRTSSPVKKSQSFGVVKGSGRSFDNTHNHHPY